jgi:Transposase protein
VSKSLSLPTASTLRKFVSDAIGPIGEGFTKVMLNILRHRVAALQNRDHQCSLVLDEMSLKCNVTYNKHLDKLVGFANGGQLANEVLVFMVRGLAMKWKQAFAYFFTHNTVNTSNLARQITDCLQRLDGIGLCVRCIVCDQGPTNVSAMRQLGFAEKSPYIFVKDCQKKIYVIFDAPHLIKNVRNNLQRHDIQIAEHVISWKHIDAFYQVDKSWAIRLAPRLTDRHLDLSCAFKMKVRPAAQVLSHSVAAGIYTRVATHELPADAQLTADFLENMDTLFDLLNLRMKCADKDARCAVTTDNNCRNQLLGMKDWVSQWKFIGARSASGIHCHWGLQTTIENCVALCDELLAEDFTFVCTARFNQDCIENFFSSIRSTQGWNENPSPAQFSTCFRNAVILSGLDSNNSGKNCIDDADFTLLKHEHVNITCSQGEKLENDEVLLSTVDLMEVKSSKECQTEVDGNFITYDLHEVIQVVNTTTIITQNDTPDPERECVVLYENTVELYTESEESLLAYLAGWLVRKCCICRECQEVLIKPAAEHSYCRRPVDLFFDKKRFKSAESVGLVQPCDQLVQAVHKAEEAFRLHYDMLKDKDHLCQSLFATAYPSCDFTFLFRRHAEHAQYLSEKLIKMFMVMRIFYAVKFNNRDLTRFGKPKVPATVKRAQDGRKMQKIMHL